MKIAFWILGLLATLFGLFVLGNAKSALHEIEAGISFVLMAILWSGAGVMSRIDKFIEVTQTKPEPQISPAAGQAVKPPETSGQSA